MSKYEKSSHRDHRDSTKYDRNERSERESRKEKERDSRRRRHRSPSYDSYDSDNDSDYDSESSREPSPRRPSRRHTTAYSDGEDRGYRGRDRHRRTRDYYSPSPSPERKGLVEDLLGAIGLVQSKDRSGGRSRSDDERVKNTKQALQAALTAAAVEAFRTRKEGKLTPQRLLQIAGAAVAAGGLDALVDRSGSGEGAGLRHIVESVVAGLATGKTMGKTIKHKRGGSVDNKVKSGLVGMAAKQILGRSLSRGPSGRRSRTNKF